MSALGDFIFRGLTEAHPEKIQQEVKEYRSQFSGVHYTVDMPE